MLYGEHACPPALRPWVECFWSGEAAEAVVGWPVRPDGCLDILYTPGDGLRAIGAMTRQRRFDVPSGTRAVGVRFRPGMAGEFLRAAPGELTDRTAALDDLWGKAGRELGMRLREAKSTDESLTAMAGYLRLPAFPPNTMGRAIAGIVRSRGTVDLDWVAAQANLSPRQFRRRCVEESGLAPKQLCRILRFRHACALASSGARPDRAQIAVGAGYFDQAHMNRDFREFTGGPPGLMPGFSNLRDRPDSLSGR